MLDSVDARQRCSVAAGLELKRRHRSPEKRDDRSGRDGRDTRPRGSYQEGGAEEHIQEAQRARGSGGKAGAQDRRRSASVPGAQVGAGDSLDTQS